MSLTVRFHRLGYVYVCATSVKNKTRHSNYNIVQKPAPVHRHPSLTTTQPWQVYRYPISLIKHSCVSFPTMELLVLFLVVTVTACPVAALPQRKYKDNGIVINYSREGGCIDMSSGLLQREDIRLCIYNQFSDHII